MVTNKEMFNKDYAIWILFYLIPIMIIHYVLLFLGYGGDGSYGDPSTKWIFLIVFMGNSFLRSKDKKEVVKRFLTALPSALLTIIILSMAIFDFSKSISFGVLMYIMLISELENWKLSYKGRFIFASCMIILISLFSIVVNSVLDGPA